MPRETANFGSELESWAAPLRLRLLLRELLSAAALSSLVGVAGLALAWWFGATPPVRALSIAVLPLALGFGALRYHHRRWSREEVALYLDARLGTREALSSALTVRSAPATPLAAAVVSRALLLLTRSDPRKAGPRLLRRHHWTGIAGLGLAALLFQLPPRDKDMPGGPTQRGPDRASLLGLKAVEALSATSGKDPEQSARLHRIAEEARRLREEAEHGLERGEALSRIATLRDRLRGEWHTFGDAASRPGREAAVTTMAEHPGLERASRALGDGDLSAFDDAMRRLASELEAKDRQKARELLEEAARRARERGSPELAELLRRAEARLEKDGSSLESLRALAESLAKGQSPEERAALGRLEGSASPKDHAQLAESLARALAQLDPTRRRALTERLRERLQAADTSTSPLAKETLRDLAKKLTRPEGQKELTETLRRLAESQPLDEAQREARLGEAERGLGEAQRQLSALPIPMTDSGGSRAAEEGSHGAPSDTKSRPGAGGPGSHDEEDGEGPGHHLPSPAAAAVNAQVTRAKASARLLPGLPMRGTSLGRTAAMPGEAAQLPTRAALQAASPDALRGVERPEIPEEYRDHVARYFNP